MANTLKTTPLHSRHRSLGARMVPFAGYEMPVQYSGVLEEAKAVRTHAGLFDVSHMGQLRITGPGALDHVNRLVTNDLSKTAEGQAQYTLLCQEDGGVIDDLVVYNQGAQGVFICVNAANRSTDLAWFQEHLPKSLAVEDESDAFALLALQGPVAEKILCKAADPGPVQALGYYRSEKLRLFGQSVLVSRTGYTGEDGFELYVPASAAEAFWAGLLELGSPDGLIPIGLGARDTLRLEMGYPLHGQEISTTITPLEAGLQWVVKLKKNGGFIGQPALSALAQSGPRRLLRGFAVEDRRMARQGAAILTPDAKPCGVISSGTFSPHLHHPIALGFVDAAWAGGQDFLLEVRGQHVPMHTHPIPFVPARIKKGATTPKK